MIQKEELRVGNWVEYSHDNFLSKPFNKQLTEVTDQEAKRSTSIPISPDILKACGFNERDDDTFKMELPEDGLLWVAKDSTWWWCIDTVNLYSDYGSHTREISYLHQLQNLYFILTGKELTINLNEKVNP